MESWDMIWSHTTCRPPHCKLAFNVVPSMIWCISLCFHVGSTEKDMHATMRPVASFTKEVNSRLAKRPLVFNGRLANRGLTHYDDVIMTMLASQITSLTVVYSIVYSDVNQRKHQSSASLAFVREIHRGPVNFPHKWPVTRKMFPFDDVIMFLRK